MWYESLPHLNVFLNATSAVLLCSGYAAIRRKAERLHARLMVSAFISSTLFLISYVTYHALSGHKAYPGGGWLRAVYLVILFSHISFAVLVLPLSLTTLYFALRRQFDRHRKIALWTLPIWVYVSVTGVVVYLMLYHGSSR